MLLPFAHGAPRTEVNLELGTTDTRVSVAIRVPLVDFVPANRRRA